MSAPRVWWLPERGFVTDGIVKYAQGDLPADAIPLVPRADREELREAIAAKFAGLDEIVVNSFADAVLAVLTERGLVTP